MSLVHALRVCSVISALFVHNTYANDYTEHNNSVFQRVVRC